MIGIGFVAFVELAWIWVLAISALSSPVGAASSVTRSAFIAGIAGSVASVCILSWVWSAVVLAPRSTTKTVSWVSHDALSSLLVTSPAWAACSSVILVTTVPWVITDISTSGTGVSIRVGDRNMAPTTVYSSNLAIVCNGCNVHIKAFWASLVLLALINGLSQIQAHTNC